MAEPANGGKGDGNDKKADPSTSPLALKSDKPRISDGSPIPADELAKLPLAVREQISSFVGMATSSMSRGPDRLLERVPPEQAADCIKLIVDMARDHTEKSLDGHKAELASGDHRHRMNVWLAAGGMVLVTTLITLCLFLGKDEIAKFLIPLIGGLGAGSLGGYGLAKARA